MASANRSEQCKRLLFEAVSENSVSKIQTVKRNYSKTDILAGLIQYVEGQTPLSIAMRTKNETLVNELVSVLKSCNNSKNRLQLLAAINRLSHQIPVMELIDYFVSDFHNPDTTKLLVFIASIQYGLFIPRQDKIVALELIGATLIINSFDHSSIYGLDCWRKAMTLRYSPADGQPLLPKTPPVFILSEASSVVFGSAVEVMTMEELDALQERFNRNYLALDGNVQLSCQKEIQLQALLVIRRICSEANQERPYGLYLLCLMTFRSYLNQRIDHNSEDNKLLINICLLVLEELNGFDPKLISHKSFHVFSTALSVMSIYFVNMLQAPLNSPGRGELTYANLLAPTKFISTISAFFSSPGMMSSTKWGQGEEFARIVYRFLCVLNSISLQMTNEEKQNLEEYHAKYIRDFFSERTSTVLHAAVTLANDPSVRDVGFSETVNLETVKLALRLGAKPNDVDSSGRPPLFILAMSGKLDHDIPLEDNYYLRMFQVLVDAGGHLDMATDDGDTVLGILKKNVSLCSQRGFVHPYFESLINTIVPLSCYCARVIRRHGIRFDEDRLPPHLQAFIRLHSAKD